MHNSFFVGLLYNRLGLALAVVPCESSEIYLCAKVATLNGIIIITALRSNEAMLMKRFVVAFICKSVKFAWSTHRGMFFSFILQKNETTE